MNAHLKLLAAAAVTVATMSVGSAQNTATGSENQVQSAADRAGDSTNRAADKTGATLDKAAAGQGVHGTAEAPDAEGIRDVLTSTTEAALKGSFSDVVERFVDADRNRLGKAMPSDDALKPLNDLAKQFREDWKAKYNQEFDFPDKEELVFNPSVRIVQGEFAGDTTGTDRARTAGERSDATKSSDKSSGDRAVLGNTDLQTMPEKKGPAGGIDLTEAAEQDRANRASGGNISGSSNASTNSDKVKVAGAGSQTPSDASSSAGAAGSSTALDANRERGRNMATVTIPASHGMPAINVPLIHELPDAWRIDIPDNLDAAKLQANLQKQLTKAHQMKGQWPADANEGYLAVAHHVLLAIFEGTPNVQQGATGAGAAQPAGATITPGAAPAAPASPAAPVAPAR